MFPLSRTSEERLQHNANYAISAGPKQLADGIADTFVLVLGALTDEDGDGAAEAAFRARSAFASDKTVPAGGGSFTRHSFAPAMCSLQRKQATVDYGRWPSAWHKESTSRSHRGCC